MLWPSLVRTDRTSRRQSPRCGFLVRDRGFLAAKGGKAGRAAPKRGAEGTNWHPRGLRGVDRASGVLSFAPPAAGDRAPRRFNTTFTVEYALRLGRPPRGRVAGGGRPGGFTEGFRGCVWGGYSPPSPRPAPREIFSPPGRKREPAAVRRGGRPNSTRLHSVHAGLAGGGRGGASAPRGRRGGG